MRSALAVIITLLVTAPSHAADPCELAGKAAPGTCAPSAQDGQGCCPKRPPCPTGQVRTAKTRGRCCWPGQETVNGRCALAPTACPSGLFATTDDCVVPVACDAGKAVMRDGRHCCWPGQRWEAGACRGAPASCPVGLVASGVDCLAPVACEGGRTRTSDGLHCCWLGQTWSGGACAGAPQCLDGFRPQGVDCVLRECAGGRVRTADGVHCCFPGQGWDDACTGTPTCPPGLFVIEGHDCGRGVTLSVLVERPPRGLEVRIDGALLPMGGTLGTRVVGPGLHEIVATAPDHQSLVRSVEVPAGDPIVVPLRLSRLPEPRVSLVPWIVTTGAVTVVGAITGIALSEEAKARREDITGAAEGGVVPAERLTQRQAQALEDEADTLESWGAVGFTLGGLAFVASGTLLVLELTQGASDASVHQVRFLPGPEGGAVIWSGTW